MSAISRLYYGTKTEKNALLYLEGHEDLMLSLLDEEISNALSKHLIGERDASFDPLLEELGLLRGPYITDRGMRIVSAYPLLGNGEAPSKVYPTEFFPFLISSLLNGHISARTDRFFQTGTFRSLFPSLEGEKITQAGLKAIDSFKKLGIISRRGSWYKVNYEVATAFMKLDEISRLAYILYANADPAQKEKGAKAISICFLLRHIKPLDWDILKNKLETFLGVSIPTEDYLSFHILQEEEDGSLTGSLRYGEKTMNGIISSDNEMSYRGYIPYDIWKIAEPVTADTITRWMISKSSIKGALDLGMKEEEITGLLQRFCNGTVPDTLLQRVSTWFSQYYMARATRAILLETDSRTNNILEQIPQMQEYILSHPAPNLFIMDSLTEDKWRHELESIGYDMLGDTKGPAFLDEEFTCSFRRLSEELDFPLSREIPFRKESFKALYNTAKTKLSKAAIASHLVFEPGIKVKLDFVSGLYYKDKLEVIEKAIAEKENLFFLDTELEEHLVKPIVLDKTDLENVLMETDRGCIPIGPIWKIAAVPAVLNERNPNQMSGFNP